MLPLSVQRPPSAIGKVADRPIQLFTDWLRPVNVKTGVGRIHERTRNTHATIFHFGIVFARAYLEVPETPFGTQNRPPWVSNRATH